MVNVTSRFTEEVVSLAESYCDDTEEPAAPEGGGRFPDYVMIPLHCLRIFFEKSYEITIDLLENMLPIVQEIGLEPADLPDPSTLCKAFDRITIETWRVLLRQSAQLHNPSEHAAIDATYFERSRASQYYCQRTNYRVQTLEATKLVDTQSQAILDVHCTTTKQGSDAKVCEQIARRNAGDLRTLAADKGYDKNVLRERLHELGIRPLIRHRIMASYDHAHNARIDDDRYAQRAMCETVFSSVKRSLGCAVRARAWYREFREIVLICCVYNIKRAVTP